MTREEARKQYGTPAGGISARQQAAQKYSYQDNTQDRRKECYEASGYDRLVSDLSRLGEETTAYFQVSHRAKNTSDRFLTRTGEMLSAIKKERDYFTRYREYFTEEERRRFNTELDGYESVLRQNRSALESGRGFLPESTAAQVDRGVKLADPLGLRKEQTAQENRAVQTQAVRKGAPSYAASSRYAAENGSGYIPFIRRVQALDEKVKKPNWQRYTAQANQIVGDAGELLSDITAMRQYFRNNAKHFTDTELTEIGDSLDRYERYLRLVSSSVSGYTSRRSMTNPLTGKQVPTGGLVLPTDTDGDGKNDSTVYGGALGLRQNYEHQKPIEDMFTGFESAERLGITEENAAEILSQARTAQEQEERNAEHYREEKERAAAYAKTVPPSDQQADAIAQARVQEYVRKEQSARKLAKDAAERADAAGAVVRSNGGYTLYNIQNTISKAMNSADYAEKSKPQEGVYSYTVDDNANFRLALSDDYDLSDATHIQNPEYGYINGTDEDRGIIVNQYAVHNAERDSFASYGYLTDEEKGTFNYLWATEGKDAAMKFLHDLKPTLDYRNGKDMAEASPGTLWGNVLSPMWHGFQGAMRNTEALLQGGREIPVSPGEYETSVRRENAGGLGRHIIDASASFGQMLPSMAISYATGNSTAGAAVTSLTSGAGAYQEGLRGGMTKEQALSYGALVGGAEGFLQSIAGGIPGLKGVLPEAVGEKIAGKITNAFGRWAVKFGANIASEVLEENVQNYLEPLFVTMLTGKDYDAPGWEEFVDTTLSTLLLTGVTNLAHISTDLTNEIDEVAQIKAAQAQFATAALSFDESSPIYAMGEKVRDALDSNKFLSGKEFREMLQEAGADQATVDRINKGAFTAEDAEQVAQMAGEAGKRLIVEHFEQSYTKGDGAQWSKERASAAAEVLYRVWRGENVRNADIQKLHLNTEKGAAVLSEVLGVPVAKAANNNVAANQTFREAEMSYRMARSTAKYGEAEINWKTLPPTQESADAIMVHPEAKAALEAIRRKPFSGTYAEQTRQIMQQLNIWWAANASRFTPEAASVQVERWRAEHPQQTEAPAQAADMDAELPEESTAINDTAEGHTARQQAVIEAYKESVDEGLVEFVQNSVNNKGQNRGRYYLNDVLPRAGQDIYELTGIDASGFKTVLEQRMAEHIYKEHGPEGTTDQSMANLNDIGRIQYVLDNYDTMRQGGRSPSYTTMKQNGKPGTAQTVVYEKAVDGKYYVVEAVPDTKAKTAFVVSAYMQKRAGAPLQTVDEQTSTHTARPENAVGAPTPLSTVPQDGAVVNPSAGENSVGAARKGFDPYSGAAIEYGTIEPGENPARVVDVPRSMDGQTMVSKLVRTAEEAGATAETAIPLIEEATTDGLFSYDRVTNEERRAKAAAWFENYNNTEAAYDAWREAAAGRKLRGMSLDTYGNGIYLYTELMANAKGAESTAMQQRYQRQAINVLSILQKSATEAGQLVQMNRMFKQLTPEGRVVSLQQSIENLNASLGKYAKQKVKLNEDLVQQWVTALNNGQEKAAALAEKNIYHDIASQVPGTFMEKWGAWRYLCMLGNPKTIIRNLGGNVAMMPAKVLKDKVGALLELTLDKSERTKYLGILSASEEGRALKTYALREFENTDLKDVITGAGKYDDSNVGGKISEAIRDAHRELPGVFGKAQDAVDFLMNNEYFGDLGFLKHHYTVSFAEAMMARGYTVADIEQGNIPAAQLDSIRAYAINQAQKATYRDINAFSKLVRNIRFRGESTGAAFGNLVIEGVLPFKATPANVLVRAAEYGPLGIVKAIGEWAQNRAIQIAQSGVESGKLNGTVARSLASKGMTSGVQIIEDLSSGLSGMALFGLGVLLKNLGVVSGDADDDDDRTGIQARSLNIGGVSISLDWLSPAAVPFFTGVSVADAWNDPHKSAIDAVADSVGAMFQPLLELSMLSSVQELLDTMNYGDGASAENIIYGVFVQPFFSYLAQGIPTLSAQLARTLEPSSQYTYTGDLGGSMAKRLVKSLAGIAKKIPFVNWRQYDYVDAWGRTESNGRWDERIFNNFFNPAYVSDIEIADADEEIARLEAVTGEEVSPSRRQYSITMNGERRALTGEEYERYSKEYGEKALEMMTVLMASADYAQMNDEEKVAALKSVLSLADEYGKHAAIDDYTPRSEDKLYQLTKTGLSITDAYAAKTVSKQLTENPAINATTAASRFKNWVSRQNWTEAQEKAVTEAYGKFMTHIPAGTEKYDALAEAIGEDTALSVVDRLATLEPENGADTVSAAQKIDAIASMNLSDKDKWAAFQEYKDDWRIEFFRKAEINPSVYAAYLEAAPEYRLTADGKKSSAWNKTTIWNWLRTTEYSYEVRQKVAQIALMKKPEEGEK